MPVRRTATAATWVVALLVAVCPRAVAEDPLAGPHAFDDGLQAIRAQLEAGDYAPGLEALKTLLSAHERTDYAKARRVELAELVTELACGARHGRPKAEDLVEGDLQSWSAKSGKIKIRFTPERSGDLVEVRDGLPTAPGADHGTVHARDRGTAKYPTGGRSDRPRVLLLGGDPSTRRAERPQSWRDRVRPARVKASRSAR